MSNNAEDKVSNFYNTKGWSTSCGITEDANKWEDLRPHAQQYVRKCRLRVLRHIPESGKNLLDLASGPIQYSEYLEYSKNFKKRYCVDLSSGALKDAESKIGDHGVFLHGSFFDISLEEDFFDCSICLHAIYHMDKEKQEQAVRKLINVTKSGKPVIVVYSNPNTIISRLRKLLSFDFLRRKHLNGLENGVGPGEFEDGYFYQHPIEWWSRFGDVASVKVFPWRSFGLKFQKKLIPNNKIGSMMFSMLFKLEERFPGFFVKHFLYSMIVLTKNKI